MLHARDTLRQLIALVGCALVCALSPVAGVAAPPKAHIIIDAASGQELISSAPDMQIYPASLTKMMTLYLLFDELDAGRLKLGSRIRFSQKAARRPPSKLGVRAGRSISVNTAILALAVKSGNDVAVAVAEKVAGSVDRFVGRMNAKAKALGMSRTRFANPSGLPDAKQVSTPRDMAQLARALRYRHKRYYKYFDTNSFKYAGRTYRTHNRFVKKYKGADGLKTGYINASGFNLAGSAVRDGRRLIGVIVGGKSAARRDLDLIGLMDAGFRLAKNQGKPRYAGVKATGVDWQTGKVVLPPRRGDAPPATVLLATAAAMEMGSRATPEPGVYAAQVGAVASKHAAANLAVLRLKTLGDTVVGGAPSVAELRLKSGRRLYRARIAGLTGAQAQRACRQLLSKGRDCLVVSEATSG